MKRASIGLYIIIALAAIGILQQVAGGSRPVILAVIVFGLIFLLYKFPPNRFNRKKGKRKHNLRVIHGTKKEDDDPPPYH